MADDPITSIMETPEFRRGDPGAVERYENAQRQKWGTAKVDPIAQIGRDPEMTPELQELKRRYEESHGKDAQQPGQQQEGAPVEFSPEWDLTQEQADEALKREWPYWYSENMAEVQNPANFAAVFGDFIKTDDDKRFLGELFQRIGNHPSALRLYLHLTKLAKRQS